MCGSSDHSEIGGGRRELPDDAKLAVIFAYLFQVNGIDLTWEPPNFDVLSFDLCFGFKLENPDSNVGWWIYFGWRADQPTEIIKKYVIVRADPDSGVLHATPALIGTTVKMPPREYIRQFDFHMDMCVHCVDEALTVEHFIPELIES